MASCKPGWRAAALAAFLLAGAGAWAQSGLFGTPQTVGASITQSVIVTAQAPGSVATVEVLTVGAPNLDFTAGGGSSTCPTAALTVGPATTCTESVTFTPAAPGVRMGAVVLLDGNKNVLGTAYLSGIGSGGLGVLVSGNILPVAGMEGAYKDPVTNRVAATQSELYIPSGVTLDGAGNLYIADTNHNTVRLVCASTNSAACGGAGYITTIAGTGDAGYTGDDHSALSATLSNPSGVALDGAGNLYIADTANNAVRKINAATGIITTVAGTGAPGYVAAQDGGPATSAELDGPASVTLDAAGNLYIPDTYNQRIRRVDALTGEITTVAGNGAAGYGGDGLSATSPTTKLDLPEAVAFDAQGNLYIADTENNRVREVSASTGKIATLAGTGAQGDTGDSRAATTAELDAPSGLAVDAAGNVYIADTQNAAIRKVSSTASATPGIISTIVQNGVGEYYSNGIFNPVAIYGPQGLFLDSSANLYFADSLNMMVREIQSNFAAFDLTKTTIREGSSSTTQSQLVEDDGNAALNLTTPDIFVDTTDPNGVNAALVTPPTTCPTDSNSFLAAADDDCVIGAALKPSSSLNFNGASSMPLTATVGIGTAGDTVNSPLEIALVGVAAPLNSTTVALASSPNPSDYGSSVTFTATVTTGTDASGLDGTVTFSDNGTTLVAGVALSGGVATYRSSTLAVGVHSITASYSGDSSHFGSSTEQALTQTVNEFTATSLASNPASPSALGTGVVFTATVTAPYGGGVALNGTGATVTFTDGATTLCSSNLTPTAGTYSATCSATAAQLTQGLNAITASYSGDAASYILSSQATLTQDVQAASTATLSSSLNPSYYGSLVQFTVTVTTVGAAAATGGVNLYRAGQTAPLNGATPLQLATVAGAGTVGFSTSSLPVSTSAAPDVITASYLGDSNYSASSSLVVNQVVNQAQTATAVSSSPNPGIAGAPEVITATVTVTEGASTPTGSITFMDGSTNLGSVALSSTGSGTATATVNPTLALGSHPILGTYAGDTNDNGSSGSLSLSVAQAATTTTLASAQNPSLVLAPVTFTASVASVGGGVPTGSVSFTDTFGGATVTLPCAGALTAGATTATATCSTSALVAGTHSIAAVYGGDTNDRTSTSNAVSQSVGDIPTLTGLGSSTSGTGVNQEVILVATVINYSTTTENASALPTPTGTVTFTSGSTVVGSAPLDATGVATLIPSSLPAGATSIVATYSGDQYHGPSTSAATAIDNPASAFTLTVTPDNPSVATSQNITVTLTLSSISGFTDTIGLGCASLPAGVNCHFSTPSIALAATGSQSVQLTIDTNNPLGGGASAMNRRPAGKKGGSVFLAGLFLPVSLLFGGLFWRFRRRCAALMTMALLLLLGGAAFAVSGCGGFTQASASPGTYVIQVTGVGADSNITRYENVTLTITK
jgi:sugar lactone lactonase YvrE